MKKWKSPSPEVVLIIGVICILIAPFLFTRNLGLISFKETGTIGDTIGGITAPITGLIGSYLVYMALKAQIEANKLISDQFKEQKIIAFVTEQIKLLREDIKEYRFNGVDSNGRISMLYGGEALMSCLSHVAITSPHDIDIETIHISDLKQIQYFLSNILYLITLAEQLKETDQIYLKRVISETYYTKLYPYLEYHKDKRLAWVPECKSCGKRHPGIPEYIYGLFDKINEQLPSNF